MGLLVFLFEVHFKNCTMREDGRMVQEMVLLRVAKARRLQRPVGFRSCAGDPPGNGAFQRLSGSRSSLDRKS